VAGIRPEVKPSMATKRVRKVGAVRVKVVIVNGAVRRRNQLPPHVSCQEIKLITVHTLRTYVLPVLYGREYRYGGVCLHI
jgi:hypothetical protein